MNIIDLDLGATFQKCFTSSSGPVIECHCGREHVCITSIYFDDQDEDDIAMIADYKKRAKTDDKLILDYDCDTISQIEIGGRSFADGCECKGWRRYMDFIITHRSEIKHEKTFEILKDKTLSVLDQH